MHLASRQIWKHLSDYMHRSVSLLNSNSMVLLMLLLLLSPAGLRNFGAFSSDVPSNQAKTELAAIQYKLLSLENSLAEKNLYAHEKDKEILFLEKRIQALKEHNKEKLHQFKFKIDEEQTMLEEVLQRKTRELDSMRREIHALEDYQQKQSSEFKQLEQTLEEQTKTLADIQTVLHATDASVLELQSYLESKTGEVQKGNWEEMQMLMTEWYKYLEIKTVHVLAYMREVKRITNNKFELAVALIRPYMDVPLAFLEPYISDLWIHTKPLVRKLAQLCDILIKSATVFHLKLQQKAWMILKTNKYLTDLATHKEIVWLLATSFVVLPLYGAFQVLTFLGKKRGFRHAHIDREIDPTQ